MNKNKRISLALASIATMTVCFESCNYKPKNQGRALYNQHCSSCHMENGQGLGELYPPVAKSDYVLANKESLACLIKNGVSGPVTVNGVTYNTAMSGNPQLTQNEISNLVYYILVELNGHDDSYSFKEVKQQLGQCLISQDES